MARKKTAQVIVETLKKNGVDTVYCIPGVQNDELFAAFYEYRDEMRFIHTRHEQGAAYMALGDALSTGKPAMYSVVPGPGFLNSSAALLNAYGNYAPVLCMTGQIPSRHLDRQNGLLHEIPRQLDTMNSLTKWSAHIDSALNAEHLVDEAFFQMNSGQPRPVGLEVPPDVLATEYEVNEPTPMREVRPYPVDQAKVKQALALLTDAKKPMIMVGGGAQSAATLVREFAERLQAPVIANRMGHGVVDSRHYLSHTTPAGHHFWADTDLVVAIGCRMSTALGWGRDSYMKVLQIDIDPYEFHRSVPADLGVTGDAEAILSEINRQLSEQGFQAESREAELTAVKTRFHAEYKELLKPQTDLLDAIRAGLPEDGILVEDMTQPVYVSRFYFETYHPRSYISTGYMGNLGWGYATALGVKAANPNRAVLSLSGDGGFMFTMNEMATAMRHKINLVSIVFNDGAFQNVRRFQEQMYDNKVMAVDLYNPDFMKLAESFGMPSFKAETPAELEETLKKAFTLDSPVLIEVPMGRMPDPFKYINQFPKVRG